MLNLLKNNEVISQVYPGRALNIPEAKIHVSPASAGWTQEHEGDFYELVEAPLSPEPEPTPPTVDDYRFAIQNMLDQAAQSRRYDSGTTISTYVNSTIPAWAAEAQAFVAWRDAVWAYAYTELDKVMLGEREQPTVEEFLAELPAIGWPDEE